MSEDGQYLYKVVATRPAMLAEGPTPEEAVIVEEHAAYVGGLARGGMVQLYGRTLNTDESAFGIVIFKAESDEAARRIMQDDPAVKKGVMRAELYPYRIAFMGKA